MTPDNFSPIPKNPVIARVFKEIGRADELGSGVRNIFKYYKVYSKKAPVLQDEDVFKCFVFVDQNTVYDNKKTGGQTGSQTGGQTGRFAEVTDAQMAVLRLIIDDNAISRAKIAERLNISSSAVQKHIEKLKQKHIIERVGPDFGGRWQVNWR